MQSKWDLWSDEAGSTLPMRTQSLEHLWPGAGDQSACPRMTALGRPRVAGVSATQLPHMAGRAHGIPDRVTRHHSLRMPQVHCLFMRMETLPERCDQTPRAVHYGPPICDFTTPGCYMLRSDDDIITTDVRPVGTNLNGANMHGQPFLFSPDRAIRWCRIGAWLSDRRAEPEFLPLAPTVAATQR
jgi:hypothetical protein